MGRPPRIQEHGFIKIDRRDDRWVLKPPLTRAEHRGELAYWTFSPVLSSPNKTIFWDADRPSGSLWVTSDGGWTPTPFTQELGSSHSSQSSGTRPRLNHASVSWTAKRIGRYDPSASVCGVSDYASLVPTLSDSWETSGPRIDRIPLARLTTLAPRIKKLFFSPPNKFSIDLFGLLANRTTLRRLQIVHFAES